MTKFDELNGKGRNHVWLKFLPQILDDGSIHWEGKTGKVPGVLSWSGSFHETYGTPQWRC